MENLTKELDAVVHKEITNTVLDNSEVMISSLHSFINTVALLNMKEKDILELVNKVFCPRVRDKKEDIKKQLLLDKLNTAINKDLEANEEKTLKLTNEQLYALRSSVECNKANININITK